MKRRLSYIIVGLIIIALVTACAKKPEKEIKETEEAVNALVSQGLGKYAPEDEKKLKDQMSAAMDEIKTQEGKTFKNYDKAKQMLADVKKSAEELKTTLPQKKEQAKQNALQAQGDAKASLEEAKKLLAKAPKGKGTAADIEALKGDVKGLEESLNEVQGLIEKEEFMEAVNKAKAVKEKADGVSNQIKEAMEKIKVKKPAKK